MTYVQNSQVIHNLPTYLSTKNKGLSTVLFDHDFSKSPLALCGQVSG